MRAKAYAWHGLPPSRRIAADAGQASSWSARALIDMLPTRRQRARQRRVLVAREDYRLKDIGISRADAELEANNKPFWRH